MSDFQWDITVLTPQSIVPPTLVAMSTAGGRTLLGGFQAIANDSGYWRLEYQGVVIMTAAHVLAWNALRAGLQGRSKTVLVEVRDDLRAPLVSATMNAATAARAVAFDIKTGAGDQPLKAGHGFSVAERFYRITEIVSSLISGSDKIWSVKVVPNLREAVAAGAGLSFRGAALRCRLATDDAMGGLALSNWKFGNSPSVPFIEDF